jgi:hypothetical protein
MNTISADRNLSFKKLKQETDEATIHWNNQGNKKEDHVGKFFGKLEEGGLDGTKRYKYDPDGYANETKAAGLTDDIFSAETTYAIRSETPVDIPLKNMYNLFIIC